MKTLALSILACFALTPSARGAADILEPLGNLQLFQMYRATPRPDLAVFVVAKPEFHSRHPYDESVLSRAAMAYDPCGLAMIDGVNDETLAQFLAIHFRVRARVIEPIPDPVTAESFVRFRDALFPKRANTWDGQIEQLRFAARRFFIAVGVAELLRHTMPSEVSGRLERASAILKTQFEAYRLAAPAIDLDSVLTATVTQEEPDYTNALADIQRLTRFSREAALALLTRELREAKGRVFIYVRNQSRLDLVREALRDLDS